jgi:hypothetical protein
MQQYVDCNNKMECRYTVLNTGYWLADDEGITACGFDVLQKPRRG